MTIKLSAFCIATEPFKSQYPIKESIKSLLPVCDEIVIVFGRYEEESHNYFQELSPKIKLIQTHSWPLDWSYDIMTQHFNIGLNNSTGDFCIKFDIDYVFNFKTQIIINQFRKILESNINSCHTIWLSKINYIRNDMVMSFDKNIYIINKFLLNKNNIKYRIDCVNYSNTIIIDSPNHQQKIIKDNRFAAFNFDCTIMDKENYYNKQYRWYSAYYKSFGNLDRFNCPSELLKDKNLLVDFILNRVVNKFINYSKQNRLKLFKFTNYPMSMQNILINLKPNQYGYSYFNNLKIKNILDTQHKKNLIYSKVSKKFIFLSNN